MESDDEYIEMEEETTSRKDAGDEEVKNFHDCLSNVHSEHSFDNLITRVVPNFSLRKKRAV